MDPLPSDWIKKESNKHPGKVYYFNKKTGKSSWEPPTNYEVRKIPNANIKKIKDSCFNKLIKIKDSSGINKIKTPAQDRLSKLQARLALSQCGKKPGPSRTKEESPKQRKKMNREETFVINAVSSSVVQCDKKTENLNNNNDNSDTSSKADIKIERVKNKSPNKVKESENTNVGSQDEVQKNRGQKRTRESTKDSIFSKIPRLAAEALGKIPKLVVDNFSKESNTKSTSTICATKPHPSNPTLSKQISPSKEHSGNNEHSFKILSTNCFGKTTKGASTSQTECNAIKKNENSKPTTVGTKDSSGNNEPAFKILCLGKIPKGPSTSQVECNADNRSEYLESTSVVNLLSENCVDDITKKASTSQTNCSAVYHSQNSKKISIGGLPLQSRNTKSVNDRLQKLRKQLESQRKLLEGDIFSENIIVSADVHNQPCNNSKENSPMDWEEIEEQITEIRQENEPPDQGVLGDFYSVVNQNLLKISAEKNNESFVKNNQYYFVIDTNVFLRNLTFIDDLRKLKFCDTECSVIVVPYNVLQELDRIKMRSHLGVSTLAVRAIKYLNEKFELKDQSIRGQNAIQANRHLISIENDDDKILNCCLQIKENTNKIILLTNDVNLRNKAICNNIPVSTKSNLEAAENFNLT